jgi:hypothetical protein
MGAAAGAEEVRLALANPVNKRPRQAGERDRTADPSIRPDLRTRTRARLPIVSILGTAVDSEEQGTDCGSLRA